MPGQPIIHDIFESKTGTWQYVVADPSSKTAVIIDPVLDYDPTTRIITTDSANNLLSLVKEKGYRVDRILETHAHADHLTAASYLQNRLAQKQDHKPPIGIGKRITQVQKLFGERYGVAPVEYEAAFDHLYDDNETFDIGYIKATAMHLPGHTPDHLGYMIGSKSARMLLALPDQTKIWTGHDYPPQGRGDPVPWMTVRDHREQNKHIRDGITRDDFDEEEENEYDSGRRSPTPEQFYFGAATPSAKYQTWIHRWRGEETGEGEIENESHHNHDTYQVKFMEPRVKNIEGIMGSTYIGEEPAYNSSPEQFYLGSVQPPAQQQTWTYRWRGRETGEDVIQLNSDETAYQIKFPGPPFAVFAAMKLMRFVTDLLHFIYHWNTFSPHADQCDVGELDRSVSAHDVFRHPPVSYRARLRYWVPDAHVDLDQVYDDIAQAGARGAAGVELLGFYLYGAERGTYVPTDWNEYGWGTPAWKRVLDTAIRAHSDNGLLMDVAMGPNQGQGVPAHEDDEGLMWDLVPHHVIVPSGKSFRGTIPGWRKGGVLQAVVTAKITNTTELKVDEMGIQDIRNKAAAEGQVQRPKTKTQYTLAESSLKDVTSLGSDDGWLDVDFSDATSFEKHQHLVFAVYLVRSGARNQQPPGVLRGPQTMPTDYVHNGSWIVDHFSAKGARVLTDFWEKHLLGNGTREQLQQVARCAWEDSIEVNPNVYWTPNLPTAFARHHGYSINKYYPLLFHGNSLIDHFADQFVTDEADEGHSHVAAYRLTLTQGYGEYLDALQKWAQSYLGVAWSSQIGYNMAVDMQSLVAKADIPECEDLAFGSNIDGYRQFTAPAFLAGKLIVSAEVGAALGQAYQMTLPRWLQIIHRLFAGGVNALVLHGLAYSGAYPNTTWPGYVPFTYAWSDMMNRQQPAWDFMKDGFFDYLARTMYVLQQGVPKLDVAFYQQHTSYKRPATNYEPDDLLAAGYTYGYLDPTTLASPEAAVRDGVLALDKQAYRALIVRGSDTIRTVEAADTLAKHAHAGLPLIFAGGLPSYLGRGSHHDSAGRAYVYQTLGALRHLDNVHFVPHEDGLADVLASRGVVPRTRIVSSSSSSSRIWPMWRETDDGSAQYAFVFNDGNERSTVSMAFQTTGRPYRYDAASGAVTAINLYTQDKYKNTTTLSLDLEQHQAILVGFHNNEAPALHATNTSAGILDVRLSDDGKRIFAIVGPSSSKHTEWVQTSDGVVHHVPASRAAPAAFNLTNWTLIVEHWDPPSSLLAGDNAQRWNSTHKLNHLASWQHIPRLKHVSGRGYYSTSFVWKGKSDGAFLSLGPVIQTVTVSVNGRALPSVDPLGASKMDISPHLIPNTHNTIEVVVSTTLANRLSPMWETLRTSGAPPTGLFGSPTKPPGDADYGLLGPVTITPYRKVALVGKAESEPPGLVKQVIS
ncbi:hypothetical protein SBRCBS47491_003494 [Sporothrix bragantina]|uniref:Metallo-beta-lactamase domain-containing protein n=1 Tax=Sporothrix bragantina TaxID=671064 RepID=A0ABP0BFR3_9PEZI